MYERLVEKYKAINATLCFFVPNPSLLILYWNRCDERCNQNSEAFWAGYQRNISWKVLDCLQSHTFVKVVASQWPSTLRLKTELLASMERRFANMESIFTLAVITLLDPRFLKNCFQRSFHLQSSSSAPNNWN